MKDSQKVQLLNEMLAGSHITPEDAKLICGCTRLAARISDIKEMGYDVKRKMKLVPTRSGKTYVAEYWIEPEVKPKVTVDMFGQSALFI